MTDDDSEALTALRPPFDLLRRYDKSFNGRLVTFGSKDLVDLGDVPVQFRYGTATLKSTNRIPWHEVYLRVKDKQGHIVCFMSLTENDIDSYVTKSGSELKISLPQGRWRVDFVSWNSRKVFAQGRLFNLRERQNLNVLMRR